MIPFFVRFAAITLFGFGTVFGVNGLLNVAFAIWWTETIVILLLSTPVFILLSANKIPRHVIDSFVASVKKRGAFLIRLANRTLIIATLFVLAYFSHFVLFSAYVMHIVMLVLITSNLKAIHDKPKEE